MIFLTAEDIQQLTGRKHKSGQIEALRKMNIQFWVNAVGRPVVSRSAIEGRPAEVKETTSWQPAILSNSKA